MPLPGRVDGFISGMAAVGPWICLSRKQRLTSNNTLYVVQFRERLPESVKEGWALMMLTSQVRWQVDKVCRNYAMGLRKLEPCDLKALRLPRPSNHKGMAAKLTKATRALLAGDPAESERIANAAISKS
jgi:hypothetical protein